MISGMKVLRRLRSLLPILALASILSLCMAFFMPHDISWAACSPSSLTIQAGAECARGNGQPAQLFGDGSVFRRITDILLFLVGAVAVIMLIVGGIRYIVSGGDQSQVTAAKNTILYAIIGIIVALLAYALVQFVLSALLKNVA